MSRTTAAVLILALAAGCGYSKLAMAAEPEILLKDIKSKDVKVRMKAAEELGEVEGDKATAALCEAALDGNSKVAVASLQSLGKKSPELAKHFTTLVVDSNGKNRIGAIDKIGELADKGKPAVKALIGIAISSIARGDTRGVPGNFAYSAIRAISAIGGCDLSRAPFTRRFAARLG